MPVKIQAAARLTLANDKLRKELKALEKRQAELTKKIKGKDDEEIDGKDLEELRKLGNTITRTREALK